MTGTFGHVLAEFNTLCETGEFQLRYCLADVQVNEKGTVDTVRVVRLQNVDKRVESAIVRSMKSGTPLRLHVGAQFPSSVGVFHCPSRAELGRKPDR